MMNEVPSAAPAATATSTWLRPPTFGPPSSSRARSAPAATAHPTPTSTSADGRSPSIRPQETGTIAPTTAVTGATVLICPCARPWYSSPRPMTLADPAIAPKARSRPVTSALMRVATSTAPASAETWATRSTPAVEARCEARAPRKSPDPNAIATRRPISTATAWSLGT